MTDKPRVEISATQVIGGALAAGSAAVAASLLGVAGTVVGAVVVSLVASVGGALYTHSFRRGKQVIDKARTGRMGRVGVVADAEPTGTEPTGDGATPTEPTAAESTAAIDKTSAEPPAGEPGDKATRPSWRERFKALNPKAVAITGACVLVLSLGGILLVEQVFLGEPVSSALGKHGGHGGNSVSRLFGEDGSTSKDGKKEPSTSPSPTPSATPTTTVTTTKTPTSKPTTTRPVPRPTTSKPTTSSSKPTTSSSSKTTNTAPPDGGGLQQPGSR